MSTSHLQTRTLTNALDRVDTVLAAQGTRLKEADERHTLASCFSQQPAHDFDAWAFSASEYEDVVAAVQRRAPDLAGCLLRPNTDRDFTVVGHCSLNLRFKVDPNGAESVRHTLRDGTPVDGARVTSGNALLYSNGLIRLPTVDGRAVYLFPLAEPWKGNAGQIACLSFSGRGKCIRQGFAVTFPKAWTENLPDHAWVTQLTSKDGMYYVRQGVISVVRVFKRLCAWQS